MVEILRKGHNMKIITSNKIIDLDKFESVQYSESFWGKDNGYPVFVKRRDATGGGFFGCSPITVEEEIARPSSEQCAKRLVAAISEAWVNGQNAFNVAEWFAKEEE